MAPYSKPLNEVEAELAELVIAIKQLKIQLDLEGDTLDRLNLYHTMLNNRNSL